MSMVDIAVSLIRIMPFLGVLPFIHFLTMDVMSVHWWSTIMASAAKPLETKIKLKKKK